MKKIILIFTLFILFTPLYSVKKNIVLVSHFQNSGNKEFNWLSNGITNSVITDLINVKDLIVISNNDRMKAIEEMQFQSSDLVNEKNNIKLGKMLGARLIVHGDYTVFMGKIKIIAKMIDVESTKILKAVKIDGDLKDVFALQDTIVIKLLQEGEKNEGQPSIAIKMEENEKKEISIQSSGNNIKAYEFYSKGLEMMRKKPQEAYSIFLRAYQLDNQNLDLLLNIAHLLSEFLSRYQEAEKYLILAEKIAFQKFGADSFAFAKVLIEYGMHYRFQNITEKGFQYLTKAQQLLEKLGRQKTFEAVYVLIGMGSCKYRQLDNKSALQYRLKAKELADAIGLEKHRFYYTDVLNDIAITYSSMYETEKAMTILQEAIKKMSEFGMEQTVDYSTLLFAVGVNYYQQGKNKEALPWFLKSLEILDKLQLQNTFHYLIRLHEIADNYLTANDCKKALFYAQKAEMIRKKLNVSATDPYTRKLPAVFNRCKI